MTKFVFNINNTGRNMVRFIEGHMTFDKDEYTFEVRFHLDGKSRRKSIKRKRRRSKRSCIAKKNSRRSRRSCVAKKHLRRSRRSCVAKKHLRRSRRSCVAKKHLRRSRISCVTKKHSRRSRRSCVAKKHLRRSHKNKKRSGVLNSQKSRNDGFFRSFHSF